MCRVFHQGLKWMPFCRAALPNLLLSHFQITAGLSPRCSIQKGSSSWPVWQLLKATPWLSLNKVVAFQTFFMGNGFEKHSIWNALYHSKTEIVLQTISSFNFISFFLCELCKSALSKGTLRSHPPSKDLQLGELLTINVHMVQIHVAVCLSL